MAVTRGDEELACSLLKEFLTDRGNKNFACKLNCVDPPDLIVMWSEGRQLGVEVVSTYLQVVGGGRNNIISSATLHESLRRFGEKIGEETKSIRRRDYTLSLGPSPSSSLEGRPNNFVKKWKKDTRNRIRDHIENDATSVLRCTGVWLKPGSLGSRWTVAVSAGVTNISSAIFCMLNQALTEKACDLPRWNGSFDSRWLLILNAHPFGYDHDEIQMALKQAICKNPGLPEFDAVLWSGVPNRALVLVLGNDLHFS